MHAEIMDVIGRLGMGPVRTAALKGEVNARMKAAASGRLRGADELEPVRTQPELWEIKWKEKKNVQLRLYHAEPGRSPDLVALHFHCKDVSDQDRIKERQEAAMQVAADRHYEGAPRVWGHRKRDCRHCL